MPTTPLADDDTALRILVVEDDADSAESLAVLLRLDGYHVEIANDGPTAVQKALASRPSVVLLDLGLPRMSGYDVARQLAGQRPERPPFMVALTGYGDREARQLSALAGIDLHLLKPVEPGKLNSVLEGFRKTGRG